MYTNFVLQVKESRTKIKTPATVAGQVVSRLSGVLFFAHLILIVVLVIFLTIRGLPSASRHHFHPKEWYPPLLSATACGGIVAFIWQSITLCYPARAVKLVFWLSPLLSCAVGVLFLLIGSAASSALGAIAIVFAVILSLYACWVNPRFDYTIRVLSISTAFPPPESITVIVLSIITSILYSCFLVSGIGGATSTGTDIDILFILVILLSLAWSLQVIRNIMQVTISRIKYLNFALGVEMEMRIALRDTFKHLMGSVCIGSILVPIFTVFWGSARSITLIVGGTDEFLFSCADCCSAVASTLVKYGNRWGFVQVGVCNKGFLQASMDTWKMIGIAGLEPVIDTDLTGSFCFQCGIAGGSICTLVAGAWTLAIHKTYATGVSIYAFFIGYFMSRIAMALPQSCVSAYYISYAENPQNQRFDSTIPDRIHELQMYGA